MLKVVEKCQVWCANTALGWRKTHICGDCVCFDPCDKTKINLRAGARFMVSFAVNAQTKSRCHEDAAISLQMISGHHRADLYTVRHCVTDNNPCTIAMGGFLVETDAHACSALLLRLTSPDSLIVEDAMLSIVEI